MKNLAVILFVLLISQSAFAFHTSMIGGVRDGLTLGMQVVHPFIGDSLMGRFILAGSTGSDSTLDGGNPLQLYLGLKARLVEDTWLAAGGIYYSGNSPYDPNTSLSGGSLSILIEDSLDIDPLFFEFGVDFMSDHPHIVALMGYRFFGDFSDIRN